MEPGPLGPYDGAQALGPRPELDVATAARRSGDCDDIPEPERAVSDEGGYIGDRDRIGLRPCDRRLGDCDIPVPDDMPCDPDCIHGGGAFTFQVAAGDSGVPRPARTSSAPAPAGSSRAPRTTTTSHASMVSSMPSLRPTVLSMASRLSLNHNSIRRSLASASAPWAVNDSVEEKEGSGSGEVASHRMDHENSNSQRVHKHHSGQEFHMESFKFIMLGDPSLMRGTKVTKVLGCFGRLLCNSKGSADTFEMSRPVDRMEVFISHNWSTPRWPKFLTLAYFFNFGPAVAVCSLGTTIVAILLFCGLLEGISSELFGVGQVSFYCSATCLFLFLATLLLGHDFMWPVGLGRTVFLDKTCIHQTDTELQKKGIESLSAYLNMSDEMLIIYTDTYLRKLWTVYELASMLCLHTAPRINVVPTKIVAVFFNLLGTGCVFQAAWVLLHSVGQDISETLAILVLFVLCQFSFLRITVRLRRWAIMQSEMRTIVDSFSIRQAACFVEDDRRTVERNVTSLMREFGYVPLESADDVALDAFDLMTQELVPLYLQSSFGRSGIPYRLAFGLIPVILGCGLDIVCMQERRNQNDRSANFWVVTVMAWSTLLVAIVPLWLALSAWLTARLQFLKGIRKWAFIVALWQVNTWSFIVCLGGELYLWHFAVGQDSAFATVLFVAGCVLPAGAAVAVFRKVRIPASRWEQLKQLCKVESRRRSHVSGRPSQASALVGTLSKPLAMPL